MDEDPPDDGDDEKEGLPARPPGTLVLLPGGKSSDPDLDYVVGRDSRGTVPTIIDPVSVDKDARERERFVSAESLVKAVKAKATTSDLIDAALLELTEELSHLKWERRKAIEDGKSTSGISLGRIGSLRTLVDILLKRKESSLADQMDLKSPRFQAVFKVWMEFFYESMEKVDIAPEVIDLVFQQMKADMVGWERRMEGLDGG